MNDAMRKELAQLLRNNKAIIAERAYQHSKDYFPHIDRSAMPEDQILAWNNAEIESISNVVETGDMSKLTYEIHYGGIVTQPSHEYLGIVNFLESQLHCSKIILTFIQETQSFDPIHAHELMVAFEEAALDILRNSMEIFTPNELRPGFISKNLRMPPRPTFGATVQSNGLPADPARATATNATMHAEPVAQNGNGALTQRETEILQLVAQGKANKEIARIFSISIATVKNHVSNILSKLHLGNRTELALFARNEAATKEL